VTGPRSPILWFGGKGNMRAKIVPILEAIQHTRYAEPFGGGASILLAKKPVELETYNDLDSAVVDLFRVLSDEALFSKFHRRVGLLPYSRELWMEYRATWEEQEDLVERVARWFVVARQSFGGSFGSSWGTSVTLSRRGMASTASGWLSCLDRLPEIHARLSRVQIENADWRVIIDRYATPETLIYCDPPYVKATRSEGSYTCDDMTLDDHAELVDALLASPGPFALSGYPHEVYQPIIEAGGVLHEWETGCYATAKTRATGLQGEGSIMEKQPRTECLWVLGDRRQGALL